MERYFVEMWAENSQVEDHEIEDSKIVQCFNVDNLLSSIEKCLNESRRFTVSRGICIMDRS